MTASFGPSYVRAIAPYIAGKPISEVAREFGLDEATIVKLASNENPLGMPESAKNAIAQAASELGRYPDSNGFELKAALSERYGVPAEWVTLGNGSNDILEIAAHAVVEKGQSIVFAQYSFAVYALATSVCHAEVVASGAAAELDAQIARLKQQTAALVAFAILLMLQHYFQDRTFTVIFVPVAEISVHVNAGPPAVSESMNW